MRSCQFTNCQQVKDILTQYNGRSIDATHFPLHAINRQAVVALEELDQPSDARWPQTTGSHVYPLVAKRLLPAV